MAALVLERSVLVTAAHRQPRSTEPWGVVHATQEGAATTVCGIPSLTWPKFWHLDFEPGGDQSCVVCSARTPRD